ncbi:MAG: hypothetical protein M3Z06_01280, partial [Actinomycetota bacterium]|nr:hypothetical protein [Actinomycetota bacterium]
MSWRTTRATDQAEHTHHQVAVIDLGSNSWRLVVFTYGFASSPAGSPRSSPAGELQLESALADSTWWKRTDELYETVRIGEGLGATGRLSEEAIDRGIETLVVFE